MDTPQFDHEIENHFNSDCNECLRLREQVKQLIYSNQCKDVDIAELKEEIEKTKKTEVFIIGLDE